MSIELALKRLIAEETIRSNVDHPTARASIARAAGLSPGTLDNLARGRLKPKYREWAVGKLNEYLVGKIERQIAALEHELALLCAARVPERDPDFLAATAALETAREAINRFGK